MNEPALHKQMYKRGNVWTEYWTAYCSKHALRLFNPRSSLNILLLLPLRFSCIREALRWRTGSRASPRHPSSLWPSARHCLLQKYVNITRHFLIRFFFPPSRRFLECFNRFWLSNKTSRRSQGRRVLFCYLTPPNRHPAKNPDTPFSFQDKTKSI